MSPLLLLMIVVIVVALGLAGWSVYASQRHAAVLERADARLDATAPTARIVLSDPTATRSARVGGWLTRILPEGLIAESASEPLVRAGFDNPSAPVLYAGARVVSALLLPALALVFMPRDSLLMMVFTLGIGVALGLGGPPAIISRLITLRQDKIRKSIPDTLDLLLVCVEAGVSLDAAVLRVGREMAMLHPEFAGELLVINRKTNAGVRREDALHGLYERTGLEELRTLASSMIQSERWGTSIGRVLRVYSETLRRKRRQKAERRAAVVAGKMVVPLALLILPALFIVIGGPMVIGIAPLLNVLSGGGP